jgi:hypothetical protein
MKKLFVASMPLLWAAVFACNAMSVPAPDSRCQGTHKKNINGICHSADFLHPAGKCSQGNCHGSDLNGGTRAPSCFSCHGPYWTISETHTSIMSSARHHNLVCTSASYIIDCGNANCHGATLLGGTGFMKGPACTKCHPLTPVASGDNCLYYGTHTKSIYGTKHYKDVCTSNSFVTSCGDINCHGAGLLGGTGFTRGPSCARCHGIPTADGSNCDISANHTVSLDGVRHHKDVCTSFTSCRIPDCHGADLLGGTAGFGGPSCKKCHGLPSHPGCDD